MSATMMGCGKKSASASESAPQSTAPDFWQSSIVSSTTAVADGQHGLAVTVRLKNADGSFILNYAPSFTVLPSSGVTSLGCTASDANGLSTCSVKSIVSGDKTFSLSGFAIHLETLVSFTHEVIPEGATLKVATLFGKTTDNYSMSVEAGAILHGARAQTRDGYQMRFVTKDLQ